MEVDLWHVQDNSERQLVDAAVGGDIESFGELCRQYYSPMVAVAYAVLSDHQLAEDAAQESFARALVSVRKLRNRARFAAWLAGICRNVAKDMVAAKARHVNVANPPHTAVGDGRDEDEKLVRRAIEQLPAAARELVILRYYDNLPYEQIAAVLGTSPAAINGRLLRAKRKIADYLKRNGIPENRL